jgi:DNA-binding transcriptional MerR regulator
MTPRRPTPNAHAGPRRLVMIADLAEQLGVTPRALRHYEDVGLIRSERTARNARAYDLEMVETLKIITLLRDVDVPLVAIGEVLRLRADPPALALAMHQALDAVLANKKRAVARIAELINTLDVREANSLAAPLAAAEPPRSGRFMRSAESAAAARGAS